MSALFFAILGVGLIYGPSVWVRYVMQKYAKDSTHIPGTGAQLAEHLLETHGIAKVAVEFGSSCYYDPKTSKVVLEERICGSRSLTAVAIAAHEFGHALQDHQGDPSFRLRMALMPISIFLAKLSAVITTILPFFWIFSQTPLYGRLMFASWLVGALVAVITQVIALPNEYDASFNKALPILQKRGYIVESDIPRVRQVLWAAALTYLAGALLSSFNIWRIFRR